MRRIVIARGGRAIADVGQPDRRLPGRARPRRPRQPVVRHASGVGAGARRLHGPASARVTEVRGGRPAGRRAGAGVDGQGRRPGRAPLRPRRASRSATRRFDAASFAAPGFLGADRSGRRARAEGDGVHRRAEGPPAGRRHPGRLLRPRLHLRAAGLALAAAPDRRRSCRPRGAWARATSPSRCRPTGHDEFAALGEEFNKMSRQLEERLEELNQERARLQDAMRRIGETFASNLDREGLLEIVVKTAVDGVGADAGRASVRPNASAPLEQVALTGDGRRPRGGRARRRGAGARDRRAVRGDRRRRRCAVAPAAPRRRRARARLGRRLGGARATGRSAPPSASSSTTSPSRRRCRSRTSACTRRSSARR